jgi:hypothetical protein
MSEQKTAQFTFNPGEMTKLIGGQFVPVDNSGNPIRRSSSNSQNSNGSKISIKSEPERTKYKLQPALVSLEKDKGFYGHMMGGQKGGNNIKGGINGPC